MPKFFNFGEPHASELKPPWRIYEKLDGKLINVFHYDDAIMVSSRGSFDNQECRDAIEILSTRLDFDFIEETLKKQPYTLCFELIHPNHQIIIDYGNDIDLAYLCAVDQLLWKVQPEMFKEVLGGPPQLQMSEGNTLESMNKVDEDDSEGYVLYDMEGNMLKIKHDSYKKLSRIQSGLNSKRLFKLWAEYMMGDGAGLERLFSVAPDEFYPWIRHRLSEWTYKFTEEYLEVIRELYQVRMNLIHEGRFDDKFFAKCNLEMHSSAESADPDKIFKAKDLKMRQLTRSILKSIAPKEAKPAQILIDNGRFENRN